MNFLPTQTTIETTLRTFYPTSRTSTKSQKSSNQRVMQQHIHVSPLPGIPHLKPHQITINLSPPDIQKIVQNPPPLLPSQSRVIVTAKASVSDESGRPLNTSQLITLPLSTIPSTYDDYKEGDESFDPFYRDVPKIRSDQRIVVSSRSSRSPQWKHLLRHKRNTLNSPDSGIVSVNHNNDTEISSIVENLNKFKNIFFGRNFDDSVEYERFSEPSPLTAKSISDFNEPSRNLGSGRRNDDAHMKTDHSTKTDNLPTHSPFHLNSKEADEEEYLESGLRRSAKEYAESKIETKKKSENRPSEEDSLVQDREKDKKTAEILKTKETEIEYHDDEDNTPINSSKDTKHFEIIITTTPVANNKELQIEYYGNQEEMSNSDQNNENLETDTSKKNSTTELGVEEYDYDRDEPILGDIFTNAESPLTKETTTFVDDDSKKLGVKDPNNKITDTIHINNDSEDITKKEVQKSKSISDSKFKIESHKSEIKEIISPDSTSDSKESSEEILETKSSSNRKKNKSAESIEDSGEEILSKKERIKYYEEEAGKPRVSSKSRPRNLIKSKHIEELDYEEVDEDDDLIDYEEERRFERRKQNGRRTGSRRSNSRSRNYEIDDPRISLKSRSSSSRRSSTRVRRPNYERERSYHESGKRRRPVSEEFESEEPEYGNDDYYTSEEFVNTSLDDDFYDEDLERTERKKNERLKSRRKNALKYEEPLPRTKSSQRRSKNRKFRDENLDYNSEEVFTLSTRENENTAGWSLEYPTSEEVTENSQTKTDEKDYTEDSNSYEDSTTSAEYLELEEVTSSTEEEKETTEELPEKTESSLQDFKLGLLEEKTEGVLKFTDELPGIEQMEETTEKSKESPMKDMRDYVDDNYEPQNYKEHQKNETMKLNSTDVEEKSDKDKEIRDANEMKIGMEESDKDKFEKTKLDESKLEETTTIATTTSTVKTTIRASRSRTKATAPTTPKLFKPLMGRRNYLYIPPSTTPVPVVIKRKISLVHPRPAKPPKSYNELAPKPVIRKKLLEARKTIIATTISSTTLEYEKEILQTTTEPITTSEITKSQDKIENHFESTSELIFTTSKPKINDEARAENKTEILEMKNDEKAEQQEDEEKQQKEANENEENEHLRNNSSSTTPLTTSSTIENFTTYPYLLSRLSTMATSIDKVDTQENKIKTEKLTEESTTLISSEMDTTTELTTMIPKSENLEPHSESTKSEVTLLKTSANQKSSKRTTKNEPGSYQGFNCLGKEMYRFYGDKRDCRLFHYCSPGFTSTQVLDFKFVCEQGTYFDEKTQSCRHDYKNPECTVRIFW